MTCECGNPTNTTVLAADGVTEVPVCDECVTHATKGPRIGYAPRPIYAARSDSERVPPGGWLRCP